MSDTATQSLLSTSHVVIPLAYFQKLLACYYGAGPRLHEPPTPPVTPPQPTEPISASGPMGGVSTIPSPPSTRPWTLKPMGAAAPKEEVKPHEPRAEPAAQG